MSDFVDRTLDPLFVLLVDWSIRWAALVLLYAAILGLCRPRRADVRHLLGAAALLAGLAAPLTPRWGGGFATAPPGVALPAKSTVPAAPSSPPSVPIEDVVAPHPAEIVASPPETVVNIPFGGRRWLVLLVTGAWMTGTGAMLVRLAVGIHLLRALKRQATPLPNGAEPLLDNIGLRRRLTLATHPGVGAPLLAGPFRATLLVPPDWLSLPEETRRACLLHEAAHAARGDDRSVFFLEAIRALFWFHPAVLWLLGRLERERELLCDERVLAGGVDAHAYARLLADFARRPGCLLSSVSALGAKRTLKTRIFHLLENPMSQTVPLSRSRAAVVGLLAFLACLAGSAFRLGAGAVPPDDKPIPATPKSDKPADVFRIAPFHVLRIKSDPETLPLKAPIAGVYLVEPDGRVALGHDYGRIKLGGLTLDDAGPAVVDHIAKATGIPSPRLSITLGGWVTRWRDDAAMRDPYRVRPFDVLRIRAAPEDLPIKDPLNSLYLVEPTGKVDLGPNYGKATVGGLSLEDAGEAVADHVTKVTGIKKTRVTVTLGGWEDNWHDLLKGRPEPGTARVDGLRHDNKTFAEWLSILKTELSTKRIIEAVHAVEAFARNGRGAEAAPALLEAAKRQSLERPEWRAPHAPWSAREMELAELQDGFVRAFVACGVDALPSLRELLKTGTAEQRRAAVEVLLKQSPGDKGGLKTLTNALKGVDPGTRNYALTLLLTPQTGFPYFLDEKQLPKLLDALPDLLPESRRAVDPLQGLLRDQGNEEHHAKIRATLDLLSKGR